MKGLSQLASPFSIAFQHSEMKGHQAGLKGANLMSASGMHPSTCVMASISIISVVLGKLAEMFIKAWFSQSERSHIMLCACDVLAWLLLLLSFVGHCRCLLPSVFPFDAVPSCSILLS